MTTETADVVVVGGGIAGISTAYFLGQAGVKCVVIERDSVGSHASGFAYGGVGAVGGAGSATGDPGPSHAVATEGVRLHKELAERLPEQTGVDIEFRPRPALSLVFTNEEMAAAKSSLRWKQSQEGYSVDLLDAKQAREVESRISLKTIGAVYVEGTYDVDTYRLVLALTQAAEGLGTVVKHGAVTGVESSGGSVKAVNLEDGKIACDKVVLAMGPWSGEASEWLGVPIEVRPLKGQILRLRVPGPPFTASIGYDSDYATTKRDGLLWTGTTEEEVGFDEEPTTAARDQIMASLINMIPSAADGRLVRQTACLRPLASDRLLVLGRVPGWDGVYMATGGGRQGIVLGPAMGKITADLIIAGRADLPIAAFDPGRFSS